MSGDGADFLYPFLSDDAPAGTDELLEDLATSARAKWGDSVCLGRQATERCRHDLDRAAEAIASSVDHGGQVLAFGNGGSAADADALVQLLSHPPAASGATPVPARSLVADAAVLTALSNDIGVASVFARQLMAHARAGDVAVGFSTSGDSANVVEAFAEARARGLVTVGFAGYDGGAMAASGQVDHCLVVASDSVHRIQEAQAVLARELWRRASAHLATGVPA